MALPSPTAAPRPRFRLDDAFVQQFASERPPFGFNGLGELVYLRTYSRLTDTGEQERWFETIRRVVEGTYTMQLRHILAHRLPWDTRKAQRSAQEMYTLMFFMRFLPPGRGLWAMGSPLTEERGLYAALFNCGYTTTGDIAQTLAEPFTWLMDASMLGIGVGFDTKGAGQLRLRKPIGSETYIVPDTREGWVDSVRRQLLAYFRRDAQPVFDYSQVRPAGEPIKGFGGVASGPEPLRELHEVLNDVLGPRQDQDLTVTDIADVMNLIGRTVVAGNVRRSSEICFGEPDSAEFLDLKNYDVNPRREAFGWLSNNSVYARLGMDYGPVAERVNRNGEPGFVWLENIRTRGRMVDPIRTDDEAVGGTNPCGEIPLESRELCNLSEVFPANHTSTEELARTIKFAYLYSKTVTLSTTPWPETNQVMLRNRRVGLSMSGVQQFVARRGLNEFREWCELGYRTAERYDDVYSRWLAIPKSRRLTTNKPSGSVALLAGATPGIHWPEARQYIRRMRLSVYSDLLPALREAGYRIEPAVGQESTTVVVEIPVQLEDGVRTTAEVSLWEQMAFAAFMQRYWSDNMVSCTVTFDPKTEGGQLAAALNYFQYDLKGISFLPRVESGAYPQMPYEAISPEEYARRVAELKPLVFRGTHEEAVAEKFCTNDGCQL